MSYKVITIKCPECGATLLAKEGREHMFCSYCGARILLDNENEYIYRHIDEAGVKQAETERLIKLKQLELEAKAREEERKLTYLKIKISVILVIVGLIMQIGGNVLGGMTGDPDSAFYLISLIGFFPLLIVFFIWILSIKNNDEK